MASRVVEIREYLMNTCPLSQDRCNPKIYAHLRGLSGYDYLFCDFKDSYGYCLVLFNTNQCYVYEKYEYVGVDIQSLVNDKVIIINKSKYTRKKINKIIKIISKGA